MTKIKIRLWGTKYIISIGRYIVTADLKGQMEIKIYHAWVPQYQNPRIARFHVFPSWCCLPD